MPGTQPARPVVNGQPGQHDSSSATHHHPLSRKEQELLVKTISNGHLPQQHLPGVLQILCEAHVDDNNEIDIMIDQLDIQTQRKLLHHVSKFIKNKPKSKPMKKARTQAKKGKPAKKQSAKQEDISYFMGQRICKLFYNEDDDDTRSSYQAYYGTVKAYYLPEQNDAGVELWSIDYEDGDGEDMERAELLECFTLYQKMKK